MIRHVTMFVLAAVLTIAGAASAHAFGLGVGEGASTVGSVVDSVAPASSAASLGDAVEAPRSGAGDVAGAGKQGARTIYVPGFVRTEDTHPVQADAYKTFEDLVNNAADGGGWHAPVVTGDVYSADGVSGGVPGRMSAAGPVAPNRIIAN